MAMNEGESSARLAIADLDATGLEEEPPADAASMAAAVAAVATPSRSSGAGHEADRRGRPSSARGATWLDADGAMRLPGERSAGSGRGTPRETNAAARQVPLLNLGELPGDEQRPSARPSSARSAGGATAAPAAAADVAATMAGATGASCSRSPASRPPAAPSSYKGGCADGDNHDLQSAWPPSPQRLAFEGSGTPRELLTATAPLSERGNRGYNDGHTASSRRRHEAGEKSARRAGSPQSGGGGYGGWDDYRGPRHAEVSPRWPSRADHGGSRPPLSARPRLQGNAAGYRDRSAPLRGGSRQGRPASGGRHMAPLSARGYSGRDSGSRGGGESRSHSSNSRMSNTFHVSCNGSRHPRQITQEVLRVLTELRISSRQVSSFLVRAQGHGCRLEAEVLQLDRGGGYVLRFSRVSGDVWVFKDVCSQLLADFQI